MPSFSAHGLRISGIASAVPAGASDLEPGPGLPPEELAKIVASTGVKSRHIAAPGTCTSDLCAAAAAHLFQQSGWDPAAVDLLLFVSQTPDYLLPATACALHGRLNLSKTCAAFDINLGCSGYVYGLSVAAAHIESGAAKRVLLLVGDTISKIVSPEDRSVAYLFGDAGTATLLEAEPPGFAGSPMHFITGTDGTGAARLAVSAGMFRQPSTEHTRLVSERGKGARRSDEHLFMDGPEIFNFTIREVPPLITHVLSLAGWTLENTDGFVFHQANQFMLNYLIKRMKLPPGKVPLALERYGNTSSASIPLAICDHYSRPKISVSGVPTLAAETGPPGHPHKISPEAQAEPPLRLIAAGFGVGFSWAAAALLVNRSAIFPAIEAPSVSAASLHP